MWSATFCRTSQTERLALLAYSIPLSMVFRTAQEAHYSAGSAPCYSQPRLGPPGIPFYLHFSLSSKSLNARK
jgi:hypothetical protein